jgi:putative ABC transport system ATP-binding protein
LNLLFTHCREIGATLIFVSHDRRMMPLFDRGLSLPDLNQV